MEFSYKLSEADYLLAGSIAVKRPGRPRARLLFYAYLATLFLLLWGGLIIGMLLEQMDLVGISAAQIQGVQADKAIVPASIVPALLYFCAGLILLRTGFLRWFDRGRRLEHFRTDPGCQAETTVIATAQSIAFRSKTGSSESIWDCYSMWAERQGILVLVTHAGVRKILKVSSLSESEKAEFRGILSAALPKK
jgi:hypothetical protein